MLHLWLAGQKKQTVEIHFARFMLLLWILGAASRTITKAISKTQIAGFIAHIQYFVWWCEAAPFNQVNFYYLFFSIICKFQLPVQGYFYTLRILTLLSICSTSLLWPKATLITAWKLIVIESLLDIRLSNTSIGPHEIHRPPWHHPQLRGAEVYSRSH